MAKQERIGVTSSARGSGRFGNHTSPAAALALPLFDSGGAATPVGRVAVFRPSVTHPCNDRPSCVAISSDLGPG
jgi:hypothetical protein